MIYPKKIIELLLHGIPKNILNSISKIKLMVFDVDGVFTDGSMLYDKYGEHIKKFNVLDGKGIQLLLDSNVQVAIVSGRKNDAVLHRMNEIGIKMIYQNVAVKLDIIISLSKKLNISIENIGFMGDDIIDMPVMEKVAFSASVPNAPIYIQNIADWISKNNGGNGAVRECCDLILATKQNI
ncbi:3-deoxy-D-manno-octulosonate 8-phosphate phosphatase kdsC [Candidatus Kinetoplastibacterium blastocrithidii TCC012E]|uniref:3-deoxy-D-manno-octulosonate 8-phosphate phosphatase KdsC n=1 Tax=Candidatus Kinetoplastidibacterium blastocrithidiae TCC012E TaxID=1208922 RepID=M1LX18_9PROT|nr:HAD hydrolase family protein [Candidatus Kinetoplastibacterium blastocrithidii]AFZ83257.1 3-deoxy-D-manno-octulosonate 8-phosphate phosphatase [Candidatus Kinetoplastibacterium blastocrithidii (ex Strigomonas culicis)]AGF50072.1 3-deoxy-D-manno-octulosonate 8-phosphate phosphatase kdsC [Candidatus Kinetoplastibacterium blastocrithidii TCC012E]